MVLANVATADSGRAHDTKHFLISHTFPPLLGGLENYWRNVIVRSPGQFTVLTNPLPAGAVEVNLERGERIIRQRLWAWPWFTPSWLPWWWRLPRLVKRSSATLLHVGHYTPLVAVIRRRLSAWPMFLYLHGTDVTMALRSAVRANQFRRDAVHARRLIVNSEYLKRLVVGSGIPAERIAVVHPGVDARAFVPDPSLQARLQRQFGLQGKRMIVSLGRLESGKGFALAIKAFALISPVYPRLVYGVVGDGPDRQNLVALARELKVQDKVIFFGPVPDEPRIKASFFRLAELSVFTSQPHDHRTESFGIAALESQAAARPVIISQAGGTSEAVIADQTALIVPPGDVAALTRALKKLLDQPERTRAMGERGRVHVTAHFRWHSAVARLEQIWHES